MNSPYVGFAIGLWYMVAPYVWDYPFGFLWWHSIIIGAAVIGISGSFLAAPGRLNGWLLMAVGVYSLLSPFLHGFLDQAFPLWNALVIGIGVMQTGVAMAAAGREYESDRLGEV